MELPINRDPQTLNKSVFEGRKWWQYLCIILSFVLAIFFTLVLGPKMDATLNGIICAVVVVPTGYLGIFSKNGLDFFEYYKAKKFQRTVFLMEVEPITKVSRQPENKKKGRKK